jgi:hypothetical protein
VPVEPERSWDHWASYLLGTSRSELHASLAGCVVPKATASIDSAAQRAPRHEDYPTLRIHGRLALIGLCSAIPVPVLRARGELGAAQLDRLEGLLEALREQGYARVVMLHHPVIATDESARRALVDAAQLRAILERQGADLVLHGHKHRRRVHLLEGRHNPVPIVGVPSSSEVGSQPDKRAQYHLYRLRTDESSGRFELDAEIRGYDRDSGSFVRAAAKTESSIAPLGRAPGSLDARSRAG